MTDSSVMCPNRVLAACLTWAALAPGLPASAQSDGAELYSSYCASCHGANLQGTGLGPELSRETYRYGGSRRDLVRIVTNGMVLQGMPAFGPTLSEEEIAAIAAFLPSGEGEPEESEPRNFDDR